MKLTRRKFIYSTLIGLPLLAAGDAFGIEPTWFRVRRIRLGEGKMAGHRFVHLTDLHHKGNAEYLHAIVAKVNEQAPEFVCFTGDIVEDTEHLEEALEIMREIKAPIFGIPGNHDYWSGVDFDRIAKALEATGGAWMLDQSRDILDGGIRLVGATCQKPVPVQSKRDGRNLLLIHYPIWADRFAPHRFDLILAGHSHGGQVRLPFIGPLILPNGVGPYDLGMFESKCGPLYVGPGIGWFLWPVRFRCRPEITVFEI